MRRRAAVEAIDHAADPATDDAARARALAPALLAWFDAGHRPLPWRATRDPYRVWVSEVMLQQTRVETVLRYWARFLERFPDVSALAAAPDEDVRAAWSGLGFYRRARNLHAAARQVVAEHGAVMPTTPDALGALPGLGRYTVGAVLSIAHDARLPILDGNVTRVLARLFTIDGDPTRGPVQRRLWSLAEAALPVERCGAFNQALMELGATVCKPRSPACDRCPIATACVARARGEPERWPWPRPRAKVEAVERAAVVVARSDGSLLLVQRPACGLLASLWEAPAIDVPGAADPDASARARPAVRTAAGALAAKLGGGDLEPRGTVEHVFTHRRWVVRVFGATLARGRGPTSLDGQPTRWVDLDDLASLGVPTVTKRILEAVRAR